VGWKEISAAEALSSYALIRWVETRRFYRRPALQDFMGAGYRDDPGMARRL
jgi:hypothetical protein